ncbi:MAG TPA: hypothetical protein VK699_09430 [Terriglobales bacterium]|nr:hypothetical protein [Terriglobales bacterium]
MKDKTKLTGDWMIALEPHRPRAVVFIFEQENRPTAKMIYDTHTLKHGENSNVPLPEKLDYVFYDIDDETEEKKYLEYRRAFDQQAA